MPHTAAVTVTTGAAAVAPAATRRPDQCKTLAARSPGRYSLSFSSSVQYPHTHRNIFEGVAELGAGYRVEVSSSGRSHGGLLTIELLHPRTGEPCSLEEWRALVPAPGGEPGTILTASSQGGVDRLGPAKRSAAASSKAHGVRLDLWMYGRSSFGEASLVRGKPPAAGRGRAVFELV